MSSSHQQAPPHPLRPAPANIAPLDTQHRTVPPPPRASSPKAPAYSPITPKVQPILPVSNGQQPFMPPPENGGNFTFQPPSAESHSNKDKPAIAPTEYIPQPPNQPFSGEDATDAIALRAAISALQFQKQKAERDIKTLDQVKQQALEDPAHFKEELAKGRLNEQRPQIGDLRKILDEPEEGDDDDEVVLGAQEDDEEREIPDSQPSHNASFESKMEIDTSKPFPRIPGPQNVVRMPYINWEKYHIVGEPLDAMHEQQKKWPGSAPFARDKGREHAVAAPYSPFLDAQTPGDRKDSASSPVSEQMRKRN